MIKGLKKYSPERIREAYVQKDKLIQKLIEEGLKPLPTPTGFMFKEDEIKNVIINKVGDMNVPSDIIATVYSMVLLENYNIVTIPAVGMPGASATIRIDLSTQDVIDMDLNQLYEKIDNSFEKFLDLSQDVEKSKELIFY